MTQVTKDHVGSLVVAGTSAQFLAEVAALAAAQVAAGTCCGVTLLSGGYPVTIASSDPRAAQLDAAQYDVHDGPCWQAIRTGRAVLIEDTTGEDDPFAAFGRRAAAHGIRSALSVPLEAGSPDADNPDADSLAGTLNLYAVAPAAFGATEIAKAVMFARHAAGALAVAHQADLTSQLHAALASRAVIDQAIGVIMAEKRCAADVAFMVLRTGSQHRNVKLRQLAAEIIAGVGGMPPESRPAFVS
ncbi:MAG: GAF and ANTAR domain-containing protein [Streptosporangiaceae bacterium]|jgi:GAF domain-containing protein